MRIHSKFVRVFWDLVKICSTDLRAYANIVDAHAPDQELTLRRPQ